MKLPERLDRIVRAVGEGQHPAKEDCVYLLDLPEHSMEAAVLMAVADSLSRKRFGNQGMLLG